MPQVRKLVYTAGSPEKVWKMQEPVLEQPPFSALPPQGYGYIYLIRTPSGKGYVGQTRVRITTRLAQHRCSTSCRAINRAIGKYGLDALNVTVLATVKASELDQHEVQFIEQERTQAPDGYNLTAGGYGSHSVTAETRARISKSLTGRKRNPAIGQAVAQALTGRKLSPETCRKISEARRGHVCPQETRRRISEAQKGRVFSAEQREHIRLSRLGTHASEAAKAHMRQAQQRRSQRIKKEKHERALEADQQPRQALR